MSIIYRKCIAAVDKIVPSKLQPLWQHPAGPKTIFFWAPLFKWGLVIAGIADLQRPADKISIAQSTSLLATGAIWSRYSLVIKPKNWSLFSVNLFVALTQGVQTFRAVHKTLYSVAVFDMASSRLQTMLWLIQMVFAIFVANVYLKNIENPYPTLQKSILEVSSILENRKAASNLPVAFS